MKLKNIDIGKALYAFAMSWIMIMGNAVYKYHDIRYIVLEPLRYIIVGVVEWTISYCILEFIAKLFDKKDPVEVEQVSTKVYILIGCFIWIDYVICWLAFYPGYFTYDAGAQTAQALGIATLSNHHPVLHTLFWKMFLLFEKSGTIPNLGLIIHGICMITLVSVTSTYLLSWMLKRKLIISKSSLYIWTTYYLLFPGLILFASEMTKDSLFANVLLVFIILLYDSLEDERNVLRLIYLGIAGIIVTLLRNNMPYALIPLVVYLFCKREKKRVMITIGAILLCNVIIVKGIYPLCGIADTEKAEMLSVPIQQMANAYINAEEKMTENQREQILKYSPWSGSYNPRIADDVKNGFDNHMYEVGGKWFWRAYLRTALQAPVEYVNAFLDLNIQSWYLNADVMDECVKEEYVETDIRSRDFYECQRRSVLPGLLPYYEELAGGKGVMFKLPLMKQLLSLSVPFWVMFLGFYYILKNKNKMAFYIEMVMGALFLTFMLGPVTSFRYLYPFYLIMPMMVQLFWSKTRVDEYCGKDD